LSRNLNSVDAAQADLDWRGYHPRAAVPAFALATVASVALLVGRWWLADPSDFTDRAIALAFYAMTLAVWPVLLSTLVYRMVTYTYRLTDRAVLVDWGFRHLPEAPVKLAGLRGVAVQVGRLGRRFGVGRVILHAADERMVTLKGVRAPETFAMAIREAAAKWKSGTRVPS
jgi:membrane protein YdbS with pleckstrin-like domain